MQLQTGNLKNQNQGTQTRVEGGTDRQTDTYGTQFQATRQMPIRVSDRFVQGSPSSDR